MHCFHGIHVVRTYVCVYCVRTYVPVCMYVCMNAFVCIYVPT